MKPLGIGIIGCGNVLSAYWPQTQQLFLEGKAQVVAACGRPAQRELVVGELGISRFVTDYRELLAMDDVDLVLSFTPAPSHFEIARDALRAGKHILSEKPMSTTLAEAGELVELANRSPNLYVPAPFTMLSPTFQTIASRIQQGEIGKPCLARGRYGWAGPNWTEWFYQSGGGPLMDLAVYNITSLTACLGPAKRVSAMTGIAEPDRVVNGKPIKPTVEDNVQLLIDFGQSCFAVITSGFTIQQYRGPGLEIYGTDGTVQMLGDDWSPDGYELWLNSVGAWQLYKETEVSWSWTDGLRHTVECIHSGAKPLVTPEHAYHVLEIILGAEKSGREGRAVEVQSTFETPRFNHEASHEPAHLVHDRTRQQLEDKSAENDEKGLQL